MVLAMATAKKEKENEEFFDFIIIGDNWAGWSLSMVLSKESHKVAIVSSPNLWSSAKVEASESSAHWPQEIEFYPDEKTTRESLQWLSKLINEKTFEDSVVHPQFSIWERGQWLPFTGFGETKSSSVDYLSQLRVPSALNLIQPMKWWKQKMVENFTGTHFHQAELTGIECNRAEESVTAIVINGNQKLHASTYLYCDSPKALPNLLPRDLISPSWHQKITKATTMTSLLLTFKHKEMHQEELHHKLYFFPGGKEHEPFVGRFFLGPHSHLSVWQSLIPDEIAENPESLGSQLRYMKRQLKKPFPKWFEGTLEEKIIVEPDSHGYIALNLQTTRLKNFLPSSVLSQKRNGIIGHLAAARSLHEKLQVSP